MTNPEQLNPVVAAFEQWRQTKNKHHTTIPTPLRQQAVALLDAYSSSKITAALRLSGAQIKNWAGAHHVDEQPPVFVQLPPVAELAPSSSVMPHSIALHFSPWRAIVALGGYFPSAARCHHTGNEHMIHLTADNHYFSGHPACRFSPRH